MAIDVFGNIIKHHNCDLWSEKCSFNDVHNMKTITREGTDKMLCMFFTFIETSRDI